MSMHLRRERTTMVTRLCKEAKSTFDSRDNTHAYLSISWSRHVHPWRPGQSPDGRCLWLSQDIRWKISEGTPWCEELNMIRVVQERSEPGCGLVDAERVSCAATSTQSVLPEDGGEQRPRKQPAPAPTRCSHETPVLDGNASDESTAESPGAGFAPSRP